MSLSGPRPYSGRGDTKYGRVYELYKRIKPGMTGAGRSAVGATRATLSG
jgi:lipopolysaccharide/colanic/teichoic acid biosynthesis glycosyltransferase